MIGVSKKDCSALGFFFCVGLSLGISGCAIGLYEYPAIARKADPQASYPAYQPNEVYFFLQPQAFPPGLQYAPVATLLSPVDSRWTRKELLSQFQTKAAELGADAIVFDRVEPINQGYGYQIYQAGATAYRLYKGSPSEQVDISSSQYGTQDPDLSKIASH